MGMLELNLRVNGYSLALQQNMDEVELSRHKFKKLGFFGRLLVKPGKGEIVWWSKNCDLRYLDDDYRNSICPILDRKAGTRMMFGTSAYLWHVRNRLVRLTFQIVDNRIVAQVALARIEEKLRELSGDPIESEPLLRTWEAGDQKLVLEYPKQAHGFIHFMSENHPAEQRH